MLSILVHVLKLSPAAIIIILPKMGVAHPIGLMCTLTQADGVNGNEEHVEPEMP